MNNTLHGSASVCLARLPLDSWFRAADFAIITPALVGMRVAHEEETEGLDTVLHNEKGYNL
jgi:ammonia channel protein AmtB